MAAAAAAAAVSDQECVPCHAEQVRSFRETGMGRSLGAPVVFESRRFRESPLVDLKPRFTHLLSRGGHRARHPVAFQIGSGNHATGYLVEIGGRLFQSPYSFYARRNAWDRAPGYENLPSVDFNRPITPDCLFCHAGRDNHVADTLNGYGTPPFAAEAISCDRCHGPGGAHAAKPSRGNIVNPARLDGPVRAAVCEQCHLGGEARILNPGRQWHDFAPGQPLEGTFSVYVGTSPGRFKVVSHVEQLTASACFRKSEGKLWCGTCHSPHRRVTDYRERCLSCHEPAHTVPSSDCVSCHMTTRKSFDSGHAAFTDHRIERRPPASLPAAKATDIVAWREPPAALAARNLGLAYIATGERDRDLVRLDRGYRLLHTVRSQFADDPDVLANLGLVLFLKDQFRAAALHFEQAVSRRPNFAPYYHKLAVAWKAAGDLDRATRILERAIEIDPSLELAYFTLADWHAGEKGRRALERYLEFNPQSIVARETLRRRRIH